MRREAERRALPSQAVDVVDVHALMAPEGRLGMRAAFDNCFPFLLAALGHAQRVRRTAGYAGRERPKTDGEGGTRQHASV